MSAVSTFALVSPLLAQVEPTDDISFTLLIELFGGLALFLLGMSQMTESLRLIAGTQMREVLSRFTTNRFAGLATGAGVTAVIQSSSVTTVLVIGFISSGLMTLTQSLGVIIGANVGTTVTAQVIAFEITTYSLLAVAVGFAITFLSKSQARQAVGSAVMGLGLVFFGMAVMGDAMAPLETSETFVDVMTRLEFPLFGILAAAAFTAIVQSSSATTGIVIVLAQQNLISIETGVALILGANVGTAVTAGLATIGNGRAAKRAALGHALFNVGGAVLWLPFIGQLTGWVGSIGGPIERQVANAHTLFNVVNAAIFIAFVPQLARLVSGLLPDRDGDAAVVPVKHLDRDLLSTPELALARTRLEIARMATRTRGMLDDVFPALTTGTRWDLLEIQDVDNEVDALHAQIIDYLREIGTQKLSKPATAELTNMMHAADSLEAIGDVIETNLVGLGLDRVDHGLVVSAESLDVLRELHEAVAEGLSQATNALIERDPEAARRARRLKSKINRLERSAGAHQAERLLVEAPRRVANYRFEVDVIANLKRVNYFSTRIARAAAPTLRRHP